jgi:hypothetical protein
LVGERGSASEEDYEVPEDEGPDLMDKPEYDGERQLNEMSEVESPSYFDLAAAN